MMKHCTYYAGILCLTLLLVACGSSPPSRHYVLTAHPATTPPSAETPSLGIGPIEVPQYLNRSNLVYNRDGNLLQVSATERWAEPLEDGLQRVISLNLASLVGTQNVRQFPWNANRIPDYAVKVQVLGLDANEQQAQLLAEWLVYRPATSETVMRRISKLQQPMDGGGEFSPQQVAPAYSKLLYQLSQMIAEAITSAQAAAAQN
jgi:uncharacterized lipoprotein YmbA